MQRYPSLKNFLLLFLSRFFEPWFCLQSFVMGLRRLGSPSQVTFVTVATHFFASLVFAFLITWLPCLLSRAVLTLLPYAQGIVSWKAERKPEVEELKLENTAICYRACQTFRSPELLIFPRRDFNERHKQDQGVMQTKGTTCTKERVTTTHAWCQDHVWNGIFWSGARFSHVALNDPCIIRVWFTGKGIICTAVFKGAVWV